MARPDQKGGQSDERSDGLREKMISVNRVTKVVKGGRILGFAALTVVGDGDGSIGMGKGKARSRSRFRRRWAGAPQRGEDGHQSGTIHHGCSAATARRVMMKPAQEGNGIKAGGAMPRSSRRWVSPTSRPVPRLHQSYNVVRATLDGLLQRRPSRSRRGKKVEEIAS
jgi:small subunit ribosomal protein S5